jgi:hypothetical protein
MYIRKTPHDKKRNRQKIMAQELLSVHHPDVMPPWSLSQPGFRRNAPWPILA